MWWNVRFTLKVLLLNEDGLFIVNLFNNKSCWAMAIEHELEVLLLRNPLNCSQRQLSRGRAVQIKELAPSSWGKFAESFIPYPCSADSQFNL